MPVRGWVVSALAATALIVIGCSSGGGSGAAAPAAVAPTAAASGGGSSGGGAKVSIKNFAFAPASITIKAGESVTWMQEDTTAHTATASDKSFDSKNLDQGKSFSHTFDKAGSYNYVCSIHASMKGTVVVE